MRIVVFITAANIKEARGLAQGILKEKLAACVNIHEGLESFFWWQGKIDSAREVLLIVKTKKSHFARLVKKVRSLHSYEVPEIIALPIVAGEKNYLKWIDESLRHSL